MGCGGRSGASPFRVGAPPLRRGADPVGSDPVCSDPVCSDPARLRSGAASVRPRGRGGGRRLPSRPLASLGAALGGGCRGGGDANSSLRSSDMRRLVSPAAPSISALLKLAPTTPAPRPRAFGARGVLRSGRFHRRPRSAKVLRRSGGSREYGAWNSRCRCFKAAFAPAGAPTETAAVRGHVGAAAAANTAHGIRAAAASPPPSRLPALLRKPPRSGAM